MFTSYISKIKKLLIPKFLIKAERKNEQKKAALLDRFPGMAYRCAYDRNRTMQFISEGCYELTGYTADNLLNKVISYTDLISSQYREYLSNQWTSALSRRERLKEEYTITTAFGKLKWVMEQGQGVFDKHGGIIALEGFVIDISDQKLREEQFQYINYHDYLTGLYSRPYFEQEKKRMDTENKLPLSIMMGDINGIRYLNDSLGSTQGDLLIKETAELLRSCCREGDVLARTGGDEFSILLPNTDDKTAYELFKLIRKKCAEYNSKITDGMNYINLSLGFSTKNNINENLDMVLNDAEDYMYKRKLLDQSSSHSAILSSMKATMLERSQETEQHAERLADYSRKIGMKLHLLLFQLYELELLATLHDVGKVGIDDRILNKPGKLTDDEWIQMKRHPEIGYRIAMSSPEFTSVAGYILHHHERWDGQGYPQGLKGEQIPLLSRIISIIDAYDAMTQDRVYRKAMPKEQAIEEINKNAGVQFDPNIAQLFIELVRSPS